MVFDKVHGTISSLSTGKTLVLSAGPRMNLWRAPTENESRGSGVNCVANEWYEARLHLLKERVESIVSKRTGKHSLEIAVRTRVAPPIHRCGFMCDYQYTILSSGDIMIQCHGVPEGDWPKKLPRIGLTMEVPGALNKVAWYGRGPGESYADSKEAGRIDVHTARVDQLFTPYVVPQENGNHMDTGWVSLVDTRGAGLFAAADSLMEFSAHRYTIESLSRARHSFELERKKDITLNLDYRQRALGTNSCGPDVRPEYELHPQEFIFSIRLKPFNAARESATSIY